MVVQAYNPRTHKAKLEMDAFKVCLQYRVSSVLSLAKNQGPGQPELQKETSSKRRKSATDVCTVYKALASILRAEKEIKTIRTTTTIK